MPGTHNFIGKDLTDDMPTATTSQSACESDREREKKHKARETNIRSGGSKQQFTTGTNS